jgi:integrase
MKDIQVWLGHSTLATTANIYTHMDEDKKIASATAIMPLLKS